jgi:hypothetical protein
MNTLTAPAWTPAAQAAMEAWLSRRLQPKLLDGADPAEVRADLLAHLHEELTAAGAGTVTEDILRTVLARMGEPLPGRKEPVSADSPAVEPASPVKVRKVRTHLFATASFWFFAILLPIGVWLFECITGACASLLFNPLPTAWHHLVVLSVPEAGWLAARALDKDRPASPQRLRWALYLTGAGLAASLFYAVLFVPFSHYAVVGIIFGVGLAALAPLFSFIALLRARVLLRNRCLVAKVKLRRPALTGGVLMTLALLAVEGPSYISRLGIHQAMNAEGDAAELAAAVQMVRRYGSEAALLRACYDTGSMRTFERAAPDPASWIAEWAGLDRGVRGWQFKRGWVEEDTVSRDLYFRVTGRPFNSAPPPKLAFQGHGGRADRDLARGGEAVAGQLRGLSLSESRLDWHCESASGLTWGEWTFTFSNSTSDAQEARCRLSLPPEGFVSRVVLWVNGEPQEAAFGATPHVRAAYKSVAVEQRRDPVLVTQPDAGSIMLQAFPVPAHGTLKTRVTFTAPATAGKVWLPAIIERNFSIAAKLPAQLWVQADGGVPASSFRDSRSAAEQGYQVLTAQPLMLDLTGSGGFFEWQAPAAAPVVWCENPFAAPEQRYLTRKTSVAPSAPGGALAWVVDGSAAMAPSAEALADLIRSTPAAASQIFLPGDSPDELVSTARAEDVRQFSFAGGRDNTPALAAALDWLRGKPGATLIWLHGPQPVHAGSRAQIEQLLERSPQEIRLFDVPLVPGENSLLPVLTRSRHLRCRQIRTNSADFPTAAHFTRQETQTEWESAAAPPPEGTAVKVSDSLARLHALTEYRRLREKEYDAAVTTAVKASLVTPDTGAVVLERAADYKAHGLTQASAKAAQQVPIIPEPSTAALLITAAALLNRRQRQRRG